MPRGADVLALAIGLRLPGLRREASQLYQDPRALPVYRLSPANILDCWNDFRRDQGAGAGQRVFGRLLGVNVDDIIVGGVGGFPLEHGLTRAAERCFRIGLAAAGRESGGHCSIEE